MTTRHADEKCHDCDNDSTHKRLHKIIVCNGKTIETNGSIVPMIKLTNMVELFSISPKLSTSVDNDGKVLKPEQADRHNRTRINLDALAAFTTLSHFYFKYVYSGPECIQEINDLHQQIIDKIVNEQNKNSKVYNMDLMNARQF